MSTLKANKYQHVDRVAPSIEINSDGSVSIAGTVTYEDVTSVDSVGMVTARSGLRATAGGLVVTAGVSTFNNGLNVSGNITNGLNVSAGIATFNNGLNITGNITNGLNVSAGIATFQAVSGTTGTFSAAVSGTTGTFSGDVSIADKIIHTGDTDTAIRFAGNDIITAEIGGTETFRIDSSGLKITDKLIHSGDTDTFLEFGTNQITFDTGGTQRFELNNYGTYQPATVPLAFLATSGDSPNIKSGGTNANDLLFTTGNAERFRISSGGILGIGTEVPYSNGLLHCDGNIVLTASSNAPKIIFDEWGTGTDPKAQIEMDQTDSTNASLKFYTEGSGTLTERLRITSAGLMGLGTGSPSDALEISHATDPAIRLHYGSNSGYSVISMDSANDVQIHVDPTGAGADSNFQVHIDGTERLELQSDGDLKLSDGDFIVGTAGHGILFHSHAAANNLDDYEEGTWSPLWSNATTGGTTCSNQMHGRYTKIGRQVIAHFYTWGLPTVGNSDAMILQGFPFATAEMSEYWGGVQAGYFNMGDDSYYNLGVALHGSTVSYGYLQFSRESGSDVAAATFDGIINGYTNFSGTISYWTS